MSVTPLDGAVVVASVAGGVPSMLRWVRVSQREHYLPGSVSRFAIRWWWKSNLPNQLLASVGLVILVAVWWLPATGFVAALLAALGPLGLGVRGRTSPMAWTRRAKTLTATATVLALVVVALSAFAGAMAGGAVVACLLVPVWVDAAAGILLPVEERMSKHFLDEARRRLEIVAPTVVGITGSYGKTSTKNHLASLIGGDRITVPTPRSFNNRSGLAKAVNEHLADGTQVFIAEMGTYGPGEIAAMCSWCPPTVSMITAIGPVHLERFGNLEVTLASKSEIAERADVVVLNVDDDRLAALADRLVDAGKRVIRAGSTSETATVLVTPLDDGWSIVVDGDVVGSSPALVGVQPTNVACAIAAAIALDLDASTVASRVAQLSTVENRLTVGTSSSGVVVVDDTFNSNPAGAAAALDVLRGADVSGRRVVVTPGMIELGRAQAASNEELGRRAGSLADVVVIVGLTNRRSLRRGLAQSHCDVIEVRDRDAAVAWVRSNLGPGDAVLYENDLPDNYP